MSEVKSDMRRKVFLIGIGMGGDSSITVRAEEIIRKSDCLIGAEERMLACAAASGGADGKMKYRGFRNTAQMRSGSLSGSILSTGISPCCCPEILVSTAEPKNCRSS